MSLLILKREPCFESRAALEGNFKIWETQMNKLSVALVSFGCVIGACGAVSQGDEGNQMNAKNGGNEMTGKNYQDEVLSNPEKSGAARAEAVHKGGNTAIINQNGYRNVSNVVQTGDDNVAEQSQTGEYNDLRVEQTGRHNRSHENQSGDYNRKVKIQNGTETIVEQVKPHN